VSRKAAELARMAAEILRQRGHGKTYLVQEDAKVCMWGAIHLANGDIVRRGASAFGVETPELAELRRFMRDKFYDRVRIEGRVVNRYPGWSWNDDPTRTQEEVEKFLLQTADELEVE